MRLDSPCPACGTQGILYNTAQTDIPYFGECMETLIQCSTCGFKHNDLIILEQKDPTRHSLVVEEEADLYARVIRGTSGTVRVPELGALIEPGPLAESFVSNVEGVLQRILGVLGQMARAGGEREKANAAIIERRIHDVLAGNERITLILEDPFGNSAIIHERAQVEAIPPEEAKKLKTGMTILDLADIDIETEGGEPDDEDDKGGVDVDDLLRP
ncbi:MAG: ZPR1 zinc finger domain-containing protein [Euryarchaeota archaeon]|nr:ZPR1 zinc finger domain-containing protein [Euryarchaeota archaeon]